MTDKIPGPYGLPILGNALDLVFEETLLSALENLADVYGPIYQIRLAGKRRTICASAELLAELTDEKRFVKMAPLALSGGSAPKGLFAAQNEDPDWGQSHRIMMPAFGPLAIEAMFDGMRKLRASFGGLCADNCRYERHCKSVDPQMGASGEHAYLGDRGLYTIDIGHHRSLLDGLPLQFILSRIDASVCRRDGQRPS